MFEKLAKKCVPPLCWSRVPSVLLSCPGVTARVCHVLVVVQGFWTSAKLKHTQTHWNTLKLIQTYTFKIIKHEKRDTSCYHFLSAVLSECVMFSSWFNEQNKNTLKYRQTKSPYLKKQSYKMPKGYFLSMSMIHDNLTAKVCRKALVQKQNCNASNQTKGDGPGKNAIRFLFVFSLKYHQTMKMNPKK